LLFRKGFFFVFSKRFLKGSIGFCVSLGLILGSVPKVSEARTPLGSFNFATFNLKGSGLVPSRPFRLRVSIKKLNDANKKRRIVAAGNLLEPGGKPLIFYKNLIFLVIPGQGGSDLVIIPNNVGIKQSSGSLVVPRNPNTEVRITYDVVRKALGSIGYVLQRSGGGAVLAVGVLVFPEQTLDDDKPALPAIDVPGVAVDDLKRDRDLCKINGYLSNVGHPRICLGYSKNTSKDSLSFKYEIEVSRRLKAIPKLTHTNLAIFVLNQRPLKFRQANATEFDGLSATEGLIDAKCWSTNGVMQLSKPGVVKSVEDSFDRQSIAAVFANVPFTWVFSNENQRKQWDNRLRSKYPTQSLLFRTKVVSVPYCK
jgi:hypothetical protein